MNKQFLKNLPIEKLFEGVYITDKNKNILLFNQAAENITGFSSKDTVGGQCESHLKHLDSSGRILCRTPDCPLVVALKGDYYSKNLYLSHMEGYRIPVEVRCLRVEGGEGSLIYQFFREKQETRRLENKIKKLQKEISVDPLTLLFNRRHMGQIIQNQIEKLKSYSNPSGILFIDIDDFKKINDSFGHDAGDMLLKNIAKTLNHSSRIADTIGRWGGEEFIIVIPGADKESLGEIAEKYRTLIRNTELVLEETTVSVSASIGGTLLNKADTISSAVKRADTLMYQSKAEGKDRVTLDS